MRKHKITLDVDVWFSPATIWQTEEENPCQCSTCCWAAKGLNAHIADLWVPGLPKHPQWDHLWWGTAEEHLPTCWEWWEAKDPPSNMVPPESNVSVDHWCVLLETWTEQEGPESEEEKHNLPEKSKDGWRHSTLRPPEQWSFQSEIMLALSRMRRSQQVHLWKAPKAKSHLSHLREKVILQKQLILGQIICLHIEVGRNVCWKKSNTMLVS